LGIVGVLIVATGGFLIWFFGLRNGSTNRVSSRPSVTDPSTGPSIEKKPTSKSTENGNVKPPDKADWIPTGFSAVPSAKLLSFDGKRYFDKIVRGPEGGKENVVMVLVRPEQPGETGRPFYMLQNKVWNALFAEFKQKRPGSTGWQNGEPLMP